MKKKGRGFASLFAGVVLDGVLVLPFVLAFGSELQAAAHAQVTETERVEDGIVVANDASGVADEESVEDDGEAVQDEDPRSRVIFQTRLQHVELGDGDSIDLVLLRSDTAIRRPRSWRPGVELAILRLDLPVGTAHLGGEEVTGLGDLYFQALNIRTPSRKFSIASGLAFQLPTATEDQLGGGKWQVAPTFFPIWTVPAVKGLVFIRAQNFVSVAGDDDRRDVNYLTLTPTLVHRLDSRRALLFDTEMVKDWERDSEVRWKSGLLFASKLGERRAYWVKLEVPWGEHRVGEWTLRMSIAWRNRQRGRGTQTTAPPPGS